MYTYTEKALSKEEISVISEKTRWIKLIAYTFKQASNIKNIKFYIHCSLEFSSQFRKYFDFDWLTGQVYKLLLIFQRTI